MTDPAAGRTEVLPHLSRGILHNRQDLHRYRVGAFQFQFFDRGRSHPIPQELQSVRQSGPSHVVSEESASHLTRPETGEAKAGINNWSNVTFPKRESISRQEEFVKSCGL